MVLSLNQLLPEEQVGCEPLSGADLMPRMKVNASLLVDSNCKCGFPWTAEYWSDIMCDVELVQKSTCQVIHNIP